MGSVTQGGLQRQKRPYRVERRWCGCRAKSSTPLIVIFIFRPQRTAELHGAESEAIAQEIRGLRQLFQFAAALRVQQVQLFAAVSKVAEAHAQQAHFSFAVAMLA